MKNLLFTLFALAGTLLCSTEAHADVATAQIDTPWVTVGMPRILHLEVTVPEDARVDWPLDLKFESLSAVDFEDPSKHYSLEFAPNVNRSIDTVVQAGNMMTLQMNLTFFAFDSAAMVIPPFKFVVNDKDTLATEMLALKCDQPFAEIPDDPEAMQGLKDVVAPEFVLWDYLSGLFWFQVCFTLLTVACICLYEYRKRRKMKVIDEVAPVKLQPAHVTALQALEQLDEKHLWQAGEHKRFHTELTDILRRYIEERYQVSAMESTTDEILSELLELTISQPSSYNNLKEVLQMADLVKFAKYEPVPDENKLVYMNSRLFIEQTKEVVVEKSPEMTEDCSPEAGN